MRQNRIWPTLIALVLLGVGFSYFLSVQVWTIRDSIILAMLLTTVAAFFVERRAMTQINLYVVGAGVGILGLWDSATLFTVSMYAGTVFLVDGAIAQRQTQWPFSAK